MSMDGHRTGRAKASDDLLAASSIIQFHSGRIPDVSTSESARARTLRKEVENRPVFRKPRRTVIGRAIHRISQVDGYRPLVRQRLPRRGPNINASLSACAV